MKRNHVARRHAWQSVLALLLVSAVCCLAALPALAAQDRTLCPVCAAGWCRTAQVPISRTTVGEEPCAHGSASATDYTVKVQYQEMTTCTRCGAVQAGEPYTVEEVSCSLNFPAVPTPAPSAAAPQVSASPLSLTEDLAAQAQAAGVQPDEQFVAKHNGALYLVQYTPPVTDWDAWQATGAAALLPQTLGDATWQRGARDADLNGDGLVDNWVNCRPLHDWESWSAGTVTERDLPAATISAIYGRDSLLICTLTLRRAAAPDMFGETFTQDDVTLHRQYTRDGALRRMWWQDDETGVVLELDPYACTAGQAAATLAELVRSRADAYTAWANA